MEDIFNSAAVFCSIASFLISIVIWIRTSEIKRDLFVRSRLPQMVKVFNSELAGLFDELESWKNTGNSDQAYLRLSNLHSLLLGISSHLGFFEKRRLLGKLGYFVKGRSSTGTGRLLSQLGWGEVWEVSVELNSVSMTLKNKVLDMRVPQ